MNLEEHTNSKLAPSESVEIHLHYLDHFFRIEQNEELQSEQRIKFFLALATGIIALLSVLKPINANDRISLEILAVFLFVLFLIGLFVFANVIWSNRKIRQHRELWAISYEMIKNIDPSVVRYKERQEEMSNQNICLPFRIFKGTLTQIMWIIEGILIAVFIFVLGTLIDCQLVCKIIIALITFTFVLIGLHLWAQYIKQGIRKEKVNKVTNSK